MPKLDECFGLVVMSCNSGNDLVHAHYKFQIGGTREEIISQGGVVSDAQYIGIVGREQFESGEPRQRQK